MRNLDPESIFNPSEFFLSTPMIESLIECIHTWLWNGVTGGVIRGFPRVGKSRAIKYLLGALKNRSGDQIPTHQFSVSRRDQNTVASIYKNLCLSLDMKPNGRTTADHMANDLIHFFAEAAMLNSSKHFVLFVDEFQRLHVRQLEAFAELYDKLADLNVNLCVIFVGNTASSQPLINHIVMPSNELIRGRFFTKAYTYYGIKSQNEVRKILKSFDQKIKHDGEVTSITKYFMGDSYKKKWKLSSLSHDIWDVFNDEYKGSLQLESWGMQYFVATIKTLLVDFLPTYGVDDSSDIKEMVRQCIELSGLVPDLVRAA